MFYKKNKFSFTILELIITIFITSVILTLSYKSFFSLSQNVTALQQQFKSLETLRNLSEFWEAQFSSLVVSLEYPYFLEKKDKESDSTFSFYTYGIYWYPGIARIEYYVKTVENKKELWERVYLPNQKEPTEWRVLKEIKSFLVRMERGSLWVDKVSKKNKLVWWPRAIRITLEMPDGFLLDKVVQVPLKRGLYQ